MSSNIYMFFNIRITIFYHNNLIPSLQAPTCSGYAERKNIRHTKFTNHIIGGEHRGGGSLGPWSGLGVSKFQFLVTSHTDGR